MKPFDLEAAKRGELAPDDGEVALIGSQPTVHDMFVCATLTGILAHPTVYRDITLQAECDGTVPGEVALKRAFEWADAAMAERKRRNAATLVSEE